MALTINQAFTELLRRIELNPTRVSLASERYDAVKRQLEGALPGKTVKQVGSFQRKTKIRPADLGDALDIDAVVSFGDTHRIAPSGQGVSTTAALSAVRAALQESKVYRVMEPEADAPTVVLEYHDKFKLELTPAFIDKRTPSIPGRPDSYLVAGTGDWKVADYDYDAEYISSVNQHPIVSGCLVPFIKIAKFWFRSKGVPLKSFYVEILATQIAIAAMNTWSQKNWTWGYHHLFAELLAVAATVVGNDVSLPGSKSPAIAANLDPTYRNNLQAYLKQVGAQAWALCNKGADGSALATWRNLYGDPFPVS